MEYFFILTIVYIAGWLPLAIAAIVIDRDKNATKYIRCTLRLIVLTFLSSAINPFLYYLFSANFRRFTYRSYRVYIAPRLVFTEHQMNFFEYIRSRLRSYNSTVSPITNGITEGHGGVVVNNETLELGLQL